MKQRSLFDGIPPDELLRLLARFERRRFAADTIVLAEGDSPHETYVVESGVADVFVHDREGVEHRIGSIAPGGTLGEMSMCTGEAASGTVRATTDLEVFVVSEAEFERLATAYPRIYRNLGAILSERLDRSNRRPLNDRTGRVTILRDRGAPPLLGYAIACSVAWHLRRPTLLLVLDDQPAEELRALARAAPRAKLRSRRDKGGDHDGRWAAEGRADLTLLTSALDFMAATLVARIEDLHATYEHVIVQVKSDTPLALPARTVQLAGPTGTVTSAEDRPGSVIRGWTAGNGPAAAVNGVVAVAPLGASDEEGLRNGVLPSGSTAGDALGWVARDLCGLKVGLALGGGAARGYAHLGVVRALRRAGVPCDYLAGTSIGAAVAALLALGLDLDEVAETLDHVGSAAFRLRVPTKSLLSFRTLRNRLHAAVGEARFEELRIPLALTAADVRTGQEVVFRRGLVWPAIAASIAIPGIYPAQRIGEYTLVDGGVVQPVPSNIVADMGADIVVGVRLMQATGAREEAEGVEPRRGSPSIFYTIMRSIELMQSKISAESSATSTILISPTLDVVPRVGLRRWAAGRQYIELGEAAAETALPRLAATLPWLRP